METKSRETDWKWFWLVYVFHVLKKVSRYPYNAPPTPRTISWFLNSFNHYIAIYTSIVTNNINNIVIGIMFTNLAM